MYQEAKQQTGYVFHMQINAALASRCVVVVVVVVILSATCHMPPEVPAA